jgi:uncharacterized alkaline shock family protein YloU
MTAPTPQSTRDAAIIDVLNPANLDGHTIDELCVYLDADRTPTNFSIESSPGCQIALAALGRLRELTKRDLEAQAAAEPAPLDGWVQSIMDWIALEARAGRDIPISHPSTTGHLTLSEGAVRGLIRAAGDSAPEVIVGRCVLDGEVTVPGQAITIMVDISVAWGENIPQAADRARNAIRRALLKHTELTLSAIHITVQDVRFARPRHTEFEK